MAFDDKRFHDVPEILLSRLYQTKRPWEIWKPSPNAERFEALAEIERKRLLGFLPYLAPLVATADHEVREASARTSARLLETDLPACLEFLSLGLIRIVQYETAAADALRGINREHVRSINQSIQPAWAAFGLLSFHSNGWVREAALDRLANVADGNEIPFLLYRANDWVDIIAKKAADILEERLTEAPVRHLSVHLSTIFNLRSRERGYLSGLHARLVARIAREERMYFFEDAARSAKPVVLRRWILMNAIAAGDVRPDMAAFADKLRRDVDPLVRASAWARIWAKNKTTSSLTEGLDDPWPTIRRRCLELLCETDPAPHQAVLEAALFDGSSMMRATARFFLAKIPGRDPAQLYRERLKSAEATMPVTILGLSESGQKDDALLIRPYLVARQVAVRRAAVSAVGKLDADSFAKEIRAALHDESPGVTKAARLALEKHSQLLTREFIIDALDERRPLHVRRASIRLISALTKWNRILTLLDALTFAPEFNDVIRGEIGRWLQMYNRSFLQPTAGQVQALKHQIPACQPMLKKDLVRELSQIASTFPAPSQ